jgi:peptidoglycan/xylan/chitin deacetylase (PgdA/CDA1 family)
MYHSVSRQRPDPYRITVTPERLAAQLGWLARQGLRGVSVAELWQAHRCGTAGGLVGLSFDDGYADFLTGALPALQRHWFTATVFMIAGRLGGTNTWDPAGPEKPLLSAAGVRRVAEAGMEVGAHGLSHVRLGGLSEQQLAAEVAESRSLLGEVLGAPVAGFCYPYGEADDPALAAVQAAGYAYATAIRPGMLTGRYALPRAYIGDRDAALRLRAKQLRDCRSGRAAPGGVMSR